MKAIERKSTKKALLIAIDNKEAWVPKSAILEQTRNPDENYAANEWDFSLAEWIIKEKFSATPAAAYDALYNEGAEGFNPYRR